jgi:hypothetical protein
MPDMAIFGASPLKQGTICFYLDRSEVASMVGIRHHVTEDLGGIVSVVAKHYNYVKGEQNDILLSSMLTFSQLRIVNSFCMTMACQAGCPWANMRTLCLGLCQTLKRLLG